MAGGILRDCTIIKIIFGYGDKVTGAEDGARVGESVGAPVVGSKVVGAEVGSAVVGLPELFVVKRQMQKQQTKDIWSDNQIIT